ncbi:BMP family lipoprotein [Streptococcus ictaluri]|uniref:Basic membrane protein n=1 Tax=Streptococcus ictaluri 707-05 TaxID=764299 RepID=G5K4R4_9STRE|nr:BMP family protein [Streptococcus ictaluri]EHI69055.1 basic membrane protein [Streptococcus ictaluri 707-05]
MNKKLVSLGLASTLLLTLGACSNRSQKSNEAKLKVAMVTDQGGIDDKSFNQSAWEGLQAWGKSQGLKKGSGFDYFQTSSESEYMTNLDTAATSGYNLIFGIGFGLRDSIEKAASENTDTHYAIVDDVIEGKDNVAGVTFADNEAAYLAGVAAAKTTQSKQIGFVGGMEGVVVKRFEEGFKAGVTSVDPSIKVSVAYAGSFADAAKGKTIAAVQYANGADVIYQAAGGTGAGVFNEAKSVNENRNASDKVWVIGVDRDQEPEGNYTSKDGKKENFVLTSSIKEVGQALNKIATAADLGKFPGGKITTFGLKEGGVNLTSDKLPKEVKKAVEDAKKAIVYGKITVPEK